MVQFTFEAIGTKWRIDIFEIITADKEAIVGFKIIERIALFDQAYSRFRSDSLVTKMSQTSGDFVLPNDAEPMMLLYRDLYLRTNGLVTPLVGNLLADAGYDANYSLQAKKELAPPPDWDKALEYHHPVLTIKTPVLLDFGAAGKGYLVDLVARVLEENGVFNYCIDAGGDILHKGLEAVRVGLENPKDTTQVIGVYELANGSICGSAGNRRKWANFNHIINPKTMVSPTSISAVWVTAKTAMMADALATCLFFVPSTILVDAYQFEYVIVQADQSVEQSAGFSGELFT